jgi:alkanesulfonate monooxygenase SsuD/methylene tetrahydromethanopterin reductase-like flavin-dependent oxidoreductase (luciferase family)
MSQPDAVPLQATDRVRPSDRLQVPQRWYQDRPADLVELVAPTGRRFGAAGPDAGYGLKLAKRFVDRLVLAPGESAHDAVAGCFACGARRAARFGRAPVSVDMEWAYTLWGYLGDGPQDLVEHRAVLFRGASHDSWDQRKIVDAVRPAALSLTPAQVREQLPRWRDLVDV